MTNPPSCSRAVQSAYFGASYERVFQRGDEWKEIQMVGFHFPVEWSFSFQCIHNNSIETSFWLWTALLVAYIQCALLNCLLTIPMNDFCFPRAFLSSIFIPVQWFWCHLKNLNEIVTHFSLLSPLRDIWAWLQPRLRSTQKHKPSHCIKVKDTWPRVVNWIVVNRYTFWVYLHCTFDETK